MRRLVKQKYAANAPDDQWRFVFAIESVTNFPVATGLASSAAGFAAIAYALGTIFNFELDDVSLVARYGETLTSFTNLHIFKFYYENNVQDLAVLVEVSTGGWCSG